MGLEDPLKKGMVTHSRILAWRILRTEEPGGVHGVTKSQRQLSDLTLSLSELDLNSSYSILTSYTNKCWVFFFFFKGSETFPFKCLKSASISVTWPCGALGSLGLDSRPCSLYLLMIYCTLLWGDPSLQPPRAISNLFSQSCFHFSYCQLNCSPLLHSQHLAPWERRMSFAHTCPTTSRTPPLHFTLFPNIIIFQRFFFLFLQISSSFIYHQS